MPSLPVVAIVGRPKRPVRAVCSTRWSQTHQHRPRHAGVTRDRITFPLNISGRYVELMDHGGYGFVDPRALTEHIKNQIELAMAQAAPRAVRRRHDDGLTSATRRSRRSCAARGSRPS